MVELVATQLGCSISQDSKGPLLRIPNSREDEAGSKTGQWSGQQKSQVKLREARGMANASEGFANRSEGVYKRAGVVATRSEGFRAGLDQGLLRRVRGSGQGFPRAGQQKRWGPGSLLVPHRSCDSPQKLLKYMLKWSDVLRCT